MRVNVVCARPDADRIIPRKSRYLAERLGWGLSPAPDPSADVNYFITYLMLSQRNADFSETSVGCYFTHYDTNRSAKAELWREAAELSDFCVTSARRNLQHLPREETYFARPPVEVDRFAIARPPGERLPVVGVSGYTYGDGRKGEHLIRELADSELSKRLILKSSGRGWPGIKTVGYPWGELPGFFQSLDVLVVPSLNEGVPMTPLEALACGVKVIIPIDVGIMDELPDVEGIYRYPKGDADEMIAATEEAAYGDAVDRWMLRDVILDDYTVDHWTGDHADALERFYYDIPDREELPDWEESCGIYMVAFGAQARRCARTAIASINEYMPGVPVLLISTEPLGPEDLFAEHDDVDIGGRTAKLKADVLSPEDWRYILYLDADTELVESIDPLFQWLEDGWELVICKDMNKYSTADMMERPDNKEECEYTWKLMGTREHAFQYNGGMMAFRRNERTEEFFRLWREEWDRWAARDQGALLRALYQHPLKQLTLWNNWNASDRYDDPPGEVTIWHHNMSARRHSGIIHGRIDSEEAWEKVEEWKRKHGTKSPAEVGH